MTKRINRLEDWITAHDAAQLLSEKLGYPVRAKYITRLAKRKRQPVRTQSLGYHQLYYKPDVLTSNVKKHSLSSQTVL